MYQTISKFVKSPKISHYWITVAHIFILISSKHPQNYFGVKLHNCSFEIVTVE